MLDSVLKTGSVTLPILLLCLGTALILGIIAAFVYSRKFGCSRSLAMTLALIPLVSSAVIMVVNGNLGAGIAVAGAFSLVRFRSAQGSAQDIMAVFLAVSLGLCCGAGYVAVAALLLVIYLAALLLLNALRFGEEKAIRRMLVITVPEVLDYEGLFDETLNHWTRAWSLERVRTAEMGSVYKLEYEITLNGTAVRREMLDQLRTLNGNMEVLCCRIAETRPVM